MKIKRMAVGLLSANCYIVSDETGQGVVIDPGGDADKILSYIRDENISVRAVLNTHGHWDHIAANDAVRDATGAPLHIHAQDAPMLGDSVRNIAHSRGYGFTSRPTEHCFADGDEIAFGRASLRVLHTPGHSPGGVCFLADGVVFSGDTLFSGSVGRADFPGCSMAALLRSIGEKLLPLPDGTKVYPGHGPGTSIGRERKNNPFLQHLQYGGARGYTETLWVTVFALGYMMGLTHKNQK